MKILRFILLFVLGLFVGHAGTEVLGVDADLGLLRGVGGILLVQAAGALFVLSGTMLDD